MRRFFMVITAGIVCWGVCSWYLMKAAGRPLENDELYSQTSSIDARSYWEMIAGRIDEGSNAPLFYALQKGIENITGYHTPQPWSKGQWGYRHRDSQLLLRMAPVVCMAVGIAVIFYYFAAHVHFLLGVYAVCVSLTSYMVYTYAAMARPYSLWFFLTALQVFLVLRLLSVDLRKQRGYFNALTAVHFLLAFTVIFSVIQNAAVWLLLWIRGRRSWGQTVALLLIPLVIDVFYYAHAPKYHFWFAEGFGKLLGAGLPLDRLGIIILALAVWVAGKIPVAKNWIKSINTTETKIYAAPLAFLVMVYAGCLAVLYCFKAHASVYMDGFQVSNRYFMVLAPVGIYMTSFAAHYLCVYPKKILKAWAWGIVVLLLIYRVIRTPWLS